MSFVKYHLPCPKCGGSDPVSVDEKGNGYCFSCQTYLKDYDGENETVSDIKTYQRNSMNTSQGSFNELTDRGISWDTAKKYGVKSILNSDGSINSHIYP